MVEERIVITCPNCGMQYRVRVSLLNKLARCARCRKNFYLRPSEYHSDEEILGWLTSFGDEEEEEVMDATSVGLSVFDRDVGERKKKVEYKRELKLASVDDRGAHFLFSSGLLNSEDFRSSFPVSCANCLTRKHLRIFLVKWIDKRSVPKGFGTAKLLHYIGNLAELPASEPKEIIKFLSPIEDLPEPFSLPFPYYVCQRCSPEKLVLGLASFKEGGQCVLRIKTPDLACQFYSNVCGADTEEYQRLCECSRLAKVNGWRELSDEIKKNIYQWFTPHRDEQFIGYIPDILSSGQEAVGESGIVITNRRMIAYKEPLWREFKFASRITITWKTVGEHRIRVDIRGLGSGRMSLLLGDKSWVNLKHLLSTIHADTKFVEV